MRVLMVQAPSVEGPSAEIVAPLGLATVAAATVAAGHEVELLDLNVAADAPAALAAALAAEPDVVGIGLRNIDPLANRRFSFLPAFAAVLETVGRALPEVPVVVGGAGFSMFARTLMERYPSIDVGVVLEGERTFPEVLSSLEAGGRPADGAAARVAGLPGTIVHLSGRRSSASTPRDNGESAGGLVTGPSPSWLSEDELDRVRAWLPGCVAPYQDTTAYAPAAGVETKRGCPLRCSYCVYPALQGRRLRFRRPRTIADEVRLLASEAGVQWVHFTDPVLNAPAAHFRELCRELIERGVPVRWTGFFREDVLTADDAALAVRAGCAAFQFSGDGTCDATLAQLGKGLTLTDILTSARHVAATEALTVYHFMVNVPGTDPAAVRRAHEMIDRLYDIHEPGGNLGAIVLNNLRVYPGTPLADQLRAAGRLPSDQELLFPTYHDPQPYRGMRYELEERVQRRAWQSLLDHPQPGPSPQPKECCS